MKCSTLLGHQAWTSQTTEGQEVSGKQEVCECFLLVWLRARKRLRDSYWKTISGLYIIFWILRVASDFSLCDENVNRLCLLICRKNAFLTLEDVLAFIYCFGKDLEYKYFMLKTKWYSKIYVFWVWLQLKCFNLRILPPILLKYLLKHGIYWSELVPSVSPLSNFWIDVLQHVNFIALTLIVFAQRIDTLCFFDSS